MKKLCVLVLLIATVITLVGCNEKKMSGSFQSYSDGHRHEFLITDSGRGDYGGEVKEYNNDGELLSTNSWYIEDDHIYINGNPCYIYRDGRLYSDEPVDGISVSDDGTISGNNKAADEGEPGALIFTDSLTLVQRFDSTATSHWKNHYYIYVETLRGGAEWGMYVVKNDVVTLYDEGDTSDRNPYYYFILDNALYKSRLDPV